MHHIWRALRGPFYSYDCGSLGKHKWERYDCDKAGCLQCGQQHLCCEKTCLARLQEDKSRICEITGLSIPVIRVCDNEFVEHCIFECRSAGQNEHEMLESSIACVVNNFFFNRNMTVCKRKENEKKIAKVNATINRLMKAHKQLMPSLHSLIAKALTMCKINRTDALTSVLAQTCVANIMTAVTAMQLQSMVRSKPNVVIGLLYLMKSGITFWLPRMQQLVYALPHENSLEKFFNVSVKIICETENEIKCLLRRKNKQL